jgi:hypothetical protein
MRSVVIAGVDAERVKDRAWALGVAREARYGQGAV